VTFACARFVNPAKFIPLTKAETGGQLADMVETTRRVHVELPHGGVIAIPVASVDHKLIWALPLVDSPTIAGFLKPFHNFLHERGPTGGRGAAVIFRVRKIVY